MIDELFGGYRRASSDVVRERLDYRFSQAPNQLTLG